MNKICTLLSLLIISISAYCQDTLVTVEGKAISIQSVEIIDSLYEVNYINSKAKQKSIDIDEVFYFTKPGGDIHYVYKQNKANGDLYTIDEMHNYIRGINDAKGNFKAPLCFAGGLTAGFFSWAILNNAKIAFNDYDFNAQYLAPLIPACYLVVINFTLPKHKINKQVKQTDLPYINGYKTEVRNKRSRSALLGSGIGLIAGYVFWGLVL